MAIHFLWSPVDGKITLICPEITVGHWETYGYRKHTEENGLETFFYSEIARKLCYKEMAGNTLN